MPKSSAARSPKSSPNCSAKRMARRRRRRSGRAGCTRRDMNSHFGARAQRANPESNNIALCLDSGSAPNGASRNDADRRFTHRRFVASAAAGLIPSIAYAQGTKPSAKPRAPDEFSVAAPVSIEVHARPIPSFDTRDRARTRFGALQYRSGVALTSAFRGFGGLSGWRLDAKGEQFIAISDKGSWFTGRILYSGREMTGL